MQRKLIKRLTEKSTKFANKPFSLKKNAKLKDILYQDDEKFHFNTSGESLPSILNIANSQSNLTNLPYSKSVLIRPSGGTYVENMSHTNTFEVLPKPINQANLKSCYSTNNMYINNF